jgi:hypothetical protein
VLPALASVTPPRSARTRSTSPPPSNPSPSRRNARRERWTAAIRSTPRAWLAPALGGASLPCGRGVEPPRAKRPSAESAQPTTPNMLAANQAKTTAPSPHRPRCCILDTIPFVAPCTREGGNPVVPGVSNAAWCGVALQWAGEVAGGGELRERSPKFAYGASVALAKSRASGVAWWTGLGAPFPELQESAFRSVSSATRVSAGEPPHGIHRLRLVPRRTTHGSTTGGILHDPSTLPNKLRVCHRSGYGDWRALLRLR